MHEEVEGGVEVGLRWEIPVYPTLCINFMYYGQVTLQQVN